MSGVIKGIGKVFKKVLKVAKVVVPIVLGAAAIIFTAGAAIPALAGTVLGGGLAGAASGLVASLGLSTSGVLGGALAGALTYGAYGAAAGGVVAAITGGNILKGMQKGALTGAAAGGIAGGFGLIDAAAPTWGAGAPSASGVPAGGILPGAEAATNPTGAFVPPNAVQSAPLPPVSAAGPTAATGAATNAATTGIGETVKQAAGGVLGEGGFLERNGAWLGPVLSGFAQGAAGDPYAEALLERDKQYAQNYQFEGGVFAPRSASQIEALQGDQRFKPGVSSSSIPYRYEYDPSEHRIKRVPIDQL